MVLYFLLASRPFPAAHCMEDPLALGYNDAASCEQGAAFRLAFFYAVIGLSGLAECVLCACATRQAQQLHVRLRDPRPGGPVVGLPLSVYGGQELTDQTFQPPP